jgi:hypothetical protein
MAWIETYHCNVCGSHKNEEQHDWWLAFIENVSPTPNAPLQPVFRLALWNDFLAHSADVLHLCGARCVQTELDRWMTAKLEEAQKEPPTNRPML